MFWCSGDEARVLQELTLSCWAARVPAPANWSRAACWSQCLGWPHPPSTTGSTPLGDAQNATTMPARRIEHLQFCIALTSDDTRRKAYPPKLTASHALSAAPPRATPVTSTARREPASHRSSTSITCTRASRHCLLTSWHCP
jgi:hypothetical protein